MKIEDVKPKLIKLEETKIKTDLEDIKLKLKIQDNKPIISSMDE